MKIKLLLVLIMLSLLPAHADSNITLTQGEYEIHSTISLPHLREALANTKTIEKRCLNQPLASELFPILKHPSFTDCLLEKGLLEKRSLEEELLKEDELKYDGVLYQLQCLNKDAATGQAYFTIDQNWFSARLEIKMGAKNMTMTQHVHANKIGECHSQ